MGTRTTGRAGIGAKLLLYFDDIFQPVANVTQVSAGGTTLNMIDATHLDSPGFYQEFIPGLKSADEWTFSLQWDPSALSHNEVKGLVRKLQGRMLTQMRIDPTGTGLSLGIEASGYISQVGNIEFSPEAIITRQATFRPVGAPLIIDYNNLPLNLNFSFPTASGYLALI